MLARMRTISEAIKEIRETDPQTALTQTALRRMVKIGEIPSVRAGCKYLVNLDTLFEYLSNPPNTADKSPPVTAGIRPVKEKIFT